MLILYIIGPAGAGKSTLTQALTDYIKHYNKEISVITINLDPGVRTLPYTADIDVQDYITVDQVIEKFQLGPNGAILKATDMMVDHINDLKYEINQYNDPELLIVDTPGQMELFSFRQSGPMIANALGSGTAKKAILFCYDSQMCVKPNGFISTLLLGASVQYRFPDIPQINLLTKKDLIGEEKIEMIQTWTEDDYSLLEAVERRERGMLKELTHALTQTFQNFGVISRLLPVSAKYNEDIDLVWGAIQQVLNDHTSPYY